MPIDAYSTAHFPFPLPFPFPNSLFCIRFRIEAFNCKFPIHLGCLAEANGKQTVMDMTSIESELCQDSGTWSNLTQQFRTFASRFDNQRAEKDKKRSKKKEKYNLFVSFYFAFLVVTSFFFDSQYSHLCFTANEESHRLKCTLIITRLSSIRESVVQRCVCLIYAIALFVMQG